MRLIAVVAGLGALSTGALGSPFTLVAIPDTQMYCAGNPAVFDAQTRWIAENAAEGKIAFVSHVGDLVNANTPAQWAAADAAMDRLDGVAPYSAAIGNHDYDVFGVGGTSSYTSAFGPARYEGRDGYLGSDPTGVSHAHAFDGGGRAFLHLSLEYGAPEATLAWAQGVLSDHPHTPTILTTHDYLQDPYTTPAGGRSAAGERIFQSLVKSNPQVFMVLCGHWHLGINGQDGQWQQVSRNDAGGEVFEMLANYQDWPTTGSEGYLRLIDLDDEAGLLRVTAYSPWLDATLPAGDGPTAGSFEYPLDFEARFAGLPEPGMMGVVAGAVGVLLRRKSHAST